MGMEAILLGVGEYSVEIVEHLDYDPDWYRATNSGSIVVSHVEQCATDGASKNLAKGLEIQPWDFNQHFISNERAKELIKLKGKVLLDDFAQEHFVALVEAGFHFIFIPNG